MLQADAMDRERVSGSGVRPVSCPMTAAGAGVLSSYASGATAGGVVEFTVAVPEDAESSLLPDPEHRTSEATPPEATLILPRAGGTISDSASGFDEVDPGESGSVGTVVQLVVGAALREETERTAGCHNGDPSLETSRVGDGFVGVPAHASSGGIASTACVCPAGVSVAVYVCPELSSTEGCGESGRGEGSSIGGAGKGTSTEEEVGIGGEAGLACAGWENQHRDYPKEHRQTLLLGMLARRLSSPSPLKGLPEEMQVRPLARRILLELSQ